MTNKTKMVSITREQLRDLIAGYCGPNPLGDLYALSDTPAEDVRAVGEEPVAFKLKECADGRGHGGRWCGPAYKCWLDPRGRRERDEDFELRKSAASKRQVMLPEFNEWYARKVGVLGTDSANRAKSVWNACLDAVEALNK